MTDKKALCFLLTFCLIIQSVLFGNVTEVQAAEPTEGYHYFDVDLFDYYTTEDNVDGEDTINYALEQGGSEFRFVYATDGTGVNGWRGSGYTGAVYQGIVKSDLTSDGKIELENNYDPTTVGIFNNDVVATGKQIYEDVKLPFVYDDLTGYYEFDSDVTNAYFDNGPNSGEYLVAEKHESSGSDSGCNWGGSTTSGGFMPFGTSNHHFGMTFATDFFMTDEGTVDNTQDGDAIKFEFSGDDDVWVFVDGKLVLDIGGIHGEIGGTIDFKEGEITVDGVDEYTTQEDELWSMLGTTVDVWRSSTTPHTLQVFYLERGAGSSNCRIRFNLPKKDYVEVSKIMGNEISANETSKLEVLNRLNFNFYISKQTANGTIEPYGEQRYRLYNVDEIYLGTYQTLKNGHFTLKFGETARFYFNDNVNEGDTFYVEEDDAIAVKSRIWTTMKNDVVTYTGSANSASIEIEAISDPMATEVNVYSIQCENEVMSPKAYDDVIVLDYGKPVRIDIMKNDAVFTSDVKLDGIMQVNETALSQKLDLEYGTATVKDLNIEYVPDKYMEDVDQFQYKLSSVSTTIEGSATVSILPANNVYYEDNFASLDATDDFGIKFSGDFTIGTSTDSTYQCQENAHYGYDESFDGQYGYSGGSATAMAGGAQATFTFQGQGVDIYCSTDNTSPVVLATISKVTESGEEFQKMIYMDNQYDQEETLYQVPTISFQMAEHGRYKVMLYVAANAGNYYLDGIRIYNPIDADNNASVRNAYQLAGEEKSIVEEVRDYLLASNDWTQGMDGVTGVVYLDNTRNEDGEETGESNETFEISDYAVDGPKNEVYLSQGNGIAFTISNYDEGQKVYIGVKSPTGKAASMVVTDGTTVKTISINSAADMYYEIIPTSDGKIMINHASDSSASLLAITKIRITNRIGVGSGIGDATEAAQLFMVDEATMDYVQDFSTMSLRRKAETAVEDEPEVDVEINDATQSKPNYEEKETYVANIVSGFEEVYNRSKEEE